MYTDHKGDLVYMPPAPEPDADAKAAEEAAAEAAEAAKAKEADEADEGKVIELKPKAPAVKTSAKAAASLQGAADSQDGAGKPAGKALEPDKMKPHEYLANIDEILAQDG